MAWGCANGVRSDARARGRIIARSSAHTFRGRKLRRSTEAVVRFGGWAVRTAAIAAFLLTAEPPNRLTAQGVLNEFSYDNLRLTGIQLDVGVLGATELTGATVGGLRLDFGRIAPKVRLLLGLSYFHSHFDQESLDRFEARLDSFVNPGTPDSIVLGQVKLGDI